MMSVPSEVLVLLPLLFTMGLHSSRATVVKPVVLHVATDQCLSQEIRESVVQNIKASVQATLEDIYSYHPNCGPGLWHRVAYLNMTDLSQHCQCVWREHNTRSGVRFCQRPHTLSGSCHGTSYTTGQRYSKVCGRAIGYQIGSTDAFGFLAVNQTIDSYYVYGVSITHGAPRNHIWTFAAGVSEGDYLYQETNCPCSNSSHPGNKHPPSFVGGSYYCESGNPTDGFIGGAYLGDPLWDGQQCEGQCCSNGKSPPWFSVDLPSTTADDIEVRICSAQADDDVGLQLLEIYVQ